jgi:hypothetical protein
MLATIRHEMADVTTGLYMISAICGLCDAVCFLALVFRLNHLSPSSRLARAFLARRYLAMIGLAFAVQMNGFGWALR